MFCIFGPNLVSLAWTGLEVSRRQVTLNLVTDRRTDTCNDNTRRPKLVSGKKKKTPELVAKALATKFGFVPDCWTGNVLWCGQAQNVVNLDFQVKFDLEDQGWLPPAPHFQTVTPVWIHWWLWNEMMHKDWSSLEEVPYCFLRSSVKFWGHTEQKITDFDLNGAFLDCNSTFNSLMDLKWCIKFGVVQF